VLDPRVTIRRSDYNDRDGEAATDLMTEYLQWALGKMAQENVVFPGSFDSASVRKGLEVYRPPGGLLLIAETGGNPIGVGALRSQSTFTFEIKRMYVRPEARGLHVGSRILDNLIAEARNAGGKLILLDSAWFMTEAQALYRSRGFVERTPYQGTEIPLNLQKRWTFFEKSL
jgi:GNAT superfamily N-acetyltransferase